MNFAMKHVPGTYNANHPITLELFGFGLIIIFSYMYNYLEINYT
ncbi:hypothetical protein R2F61_00130 [Mollicutes bacterium LVI A0078]|nr:hypothetical protein RZE84_00130 [Mollicutes bacterium LVI A0075]WOO90987.1 hypothetical protein R2F61_00130 [Mollicutes bacterium LVI A0078]